MPVFEYTALNEKGKKLRGIIDAQSSGAARQKLRESNIYLIELQESSGKKKESLLQRVAGGFFGKSGSREVTVMTRQLATLLGASMAFKRGAHLGMTFIDGLLPPKGRRIISLFVAACGVGLFAILFCYGVDMVIQEYESEMVTYSMALPMWWFGLSVPIGSLLVIIRVIQAACQELRALNQKMGG